MKKGGLSLSMGQLVILIVSLVLLMIMYYIINGGIVNTKAGVCGTSTDMLNELLQLISLAPTSSACPA